MILYLLLLTVSLTGRTQKLPGQQNDDTCVCKVKSSVWAFPAKRFEDIETRVRICEENLKDFQKKLKINHAELPKMQTTVNNVKKRLKRFEHLNNNGLYTDLDLQHLSHELNEIHQTASEAHDRNPSAATRKLLRELIKAKKDIETVQKNNFFNLEGMKKTLQDLHNRAQTCKTIPGDFRSACHQRIMSKISSPSVTKLNSLSKSYVSGAWGRDAKLNSKLLYWEHWLVSNHRHGNTIRIFNTYGDFMANKNYKDEYVASAYNHANAIEGSGTILYDNTVFYQCYGKAEICSFNITTKETKRMTLTGAGVNNNFPFCYYSCRHWTDIDLEADQDALWVIYATEENHGNIVLSRLNPVALNVTHTWKTHLFKRSVTSTFMVCGVLYATRYVNTYKEEVFYAFDTVTGQEINTLSLPFEKVVAGIANLNFNPVDRKLYMYNDGYLLAYDTFF